MVQTLKVFGWNQYPPPSSPPNLSVPGQGPVAISIVGWDREGALPPGAVFSAIGVYTIRKCILKQPQNQI